MADNVLRARTPTELVDASIQLLRRHYVSLVIVSGIGMAPWLVIRPLFERALGLNNVAATASDLFIALALNVVASIWYSLAGAAIVTAAAQGYLEGHVDVGGAIQQVVGRVGAVLYASFVRNIMIGLGLLLIFIGAFYNYATNFGVPSTVMLEKLDGVHGLQRSKQLATGNRGHILKTMGLIFGIYVIFLIAVGAIAGLAFGNANRTLSGIFVTIVTMLVYPIVPVTEMLIYYDLRIRMEGFDVEMMASRLDAAAPSGT